MPDSVMCWQYISEKKGEGQVNGWLEDILEKGEGGYVF